ncbi:Protein SUPPRESSOR OF GENE SILENCING [Orobanche gracilis]
MSSRKGVANPSSAATSIPLFIGKSTSEMMDGRTMERNRNNASKQLPPQQSTPTAWGSNSDTSQKLGLRSHGGLGRGSAQTRPTILPDSRKHLGRGFVKPQSSNQTPDSHNAVPHAVVPPPPKSGWGGWSARSVSNQPSSEDSIEAHTISNQASMFDEVDDGGEESHDVDDTDDKLLSDGFDSDESQKSHETRKKNR